MTRLTFQEDSYLRESDARIDEVTQDGLVLDNTIFYPQGGGQDTDRGSILAEGAEFQINEVRRVDGRVVHKTDRPLEGLEAGMPVRMVLDWERRYPMMRFHTALHIVSHVAYDEYGAQITGNNISPDKARIDLSLEGLDDKVVREIEARTNEIISMAIPVLIKNCPREEAEGLVDPHKTRLDMIPPSIRQIRLVVIGDKDIDACGGTHVKNTSEIGGIEIYNALNKGKGRKRLEMHLKD